jgi:hypothetical protein
MPIVLPNLDDRRYQQLVDESLARIPVHTPEWTNFNQSDPGVTLIQIFAFLTESLLYRCNQIPERNHKKFLQLLGVPLNPASSARGIVTFTNERGPLETITLNEDLEVRAGQIPFRTERGLDVLPIEARVYFKGVRSLPPADQKDARDAYDRDLAHYKELYAALFPDDSAAEPKLYEPLPLTSRGAQGVDLGSDTVDRTLWVALLLREGDKPVSDPMLNEARKQIAGKTLSLGIVPQVEGEDIRCRLPPGGETAGATALLEISSPVIPPSGGLPASRTPGYRRLGTEPVPAEPVVFDVALPTDEKQLDIWNDLDPLEAGTNDLPPALDDSGLNERVLTWLRVTWPAGTHARVQWAGINAAFVRQRARISSELLPTSTGEPDQEFTLANTPVIPETIRLTVTTTENQTSEWKLIDDLLSAGPEVPVVDPRQPPGVKPPPPQPANVFVLEAESGKIRFGDGFRGARPPIGANIRVDYDYGQGAEGNVGERQINSAPALPAGLKVENPVRTWGGAAAESVGEGEKQVTRFLQHRDRLVNAADFETITLRTPGVEIGRVEVLPAYNPLLARHEPGNAPGAVTLMIIPKFDLKRPDAPEPDDIFLRAICDYLDPRRLVTTELFLHGPDYVPIFISVGISVVTGRNFSAAVVREQVVQRLKEFLAPVKAEVAGQLDDQAALLTTPNAAPERKGWPLRRPVIARELEAEVARVTGVAMVNGLILADASVKDPEGLTQIEMQGLQLPRVDGIQVSVGDPPPLSAVRGDSPEGKQPPSPSLVPVPAIPKEC